MKSKRQQTMSGDTAYYTRHLRQGRECMQSEKRDHLVLNYNYWPQIASYSTKASRYRKS